MANYNSKNVMLVGLKGADGLGVPAGGTTGQVLKKRSNTDNDTEWGNDGGAVSSVNGQTGTVVLDADDIAYSGDDSVKDEIDSVKEDLADKVDKVTGKGLSTNDYDATEKANVASNTSARHTHSNKALLDTYNQTEVNLADAVSKKHSHSNKAILDSITEIGALASKDTVAPTDTDFLTKQTTVIPAEELYDITGIRTGGYYDMNDGTWTTSSSFWSTNMMCVNYHSCTVIIHKETAPTCQIVYWDDNNHCMGGISGPSFTQVSAGVWQFNVSYQGAMYISLNAKTSIAQNGVSCSNGQSTTDYSYNTTYPINSGNIEGLGRQWNGKKWTALGTSITNTSEGYGKFTPYLEEMSGMVLTNRGVSGAVCGGHILYYAQNDATLPNADIITIEGFVNDLVSSANDGTTLGVLLGNVGDTVPYPVTFQSPVWDNGGTASGTFAGACYKVFKTVQERNQKAVIIYIADQTGRNVASTGANFSRSRKNGRNLIQRDYTDMAIKVAEYMGIRVIDAGRLAHITEEHPLYYADHIHHSELGGKEYATVIWNELKTIPLLTK